MVELNGLDGYPGLAGGQGRVAPQVREQVRARVALKGGADAFPWAASKSERQESFWSSWSWCVVARWMTVPPSESGSSLKEPAVVWSGRRGRAVRRRLQAISLQPCLIRLIIITKTFTFTAAQAHVS